MGPEVRLAEIASVGVDERDGRFWVALSQEQVRDLVQRDAARHRGDGRGLFRVVLALEGLGERISTEELAHDERYASGRISRSTIHGLVVLGAFALGEVHGIKSLGVELGMSTSTTWRYVKTWVAVGILEEREDRRYQLARRWIDDPQELAKSRRRGQ